MQLMGDESPDVERPDSYLSTLRAFLGGYQPEPEEVDAAVLMVLTAEEEPSFILTRRATHLSSHAGEVAFAGGKCDPQDLSREMTALRESQEEIGLAPSQVEIIGRMGLFVSRAGLRVQPFIGLVAPEVALTANPEEIESIFRVPLRFFLEQPLEFTHHIHFMGNEFIAPCFNYAGYVIWGLTAYMIVDLMNRAFEAGIDFPMPFLRVTGDTAL